jgi:16S rRNA (cytosine1402-N4)-methyltransferase
MICEVVEYLAPVPHGLYVDVTFGGGGHSEAILKAEPTCKIIACDWDTNALSMNGPILEQKFPGRVTLLWTNFARLSDHLRKMGIAQVNGLLADFGTSRHQIEAGLGFSYMRDTPLDMRMSSAHQKTTAHDILHQASEHELVHILGTYGGERNAKGIAHEIVLARMRGESLKTTTDLVRVVERVIPTRVGNIHQATKTFQALRIVVNKELENIHALLTQAPSIIASGGRLVCISFHELEDRLVKNAMTEHPEVWRAITRQIVIPSDNEIKANPASRSARLRCAQRV